MNATSKDLRYKTKAILKAVAAGKKVVITNRGKPRAVIVSIDSASVDDAHELTNDIAGMWADREDLGDVAAHVRTLRKGRLNL